MSETNVATEKISICDLVKNDSSEIIHKMESKVPTIIQRYTDLYTEYLKLCDNLFGTCYIAEKEFFEKLNLDQNLLKEIKKSSTQVKNQALNNVEFGTIFFDVMIKTRISTIRTYDIYMRAMLETWSKMLSDYNNKK